MPPQQAPYRGYLTPFGPLLDPYLAPNHPEIALNRAISRHRTGYTNICYVSISCPITGITLTKLVITVRAQNDIRPQGNTYPQNATPIITSIISTPLPYVGASLFSSRGS